MADTGHHMRQDVADTNLSLKHRRLGFKEAEGRVSGLKVAALAAFLLMGANVFQFFPMLKHVREVWYVFSFLYCVLFAFFAQVGSRHKSISGFEVYLFAIIAVMPFISAICAKYTFGQPLLPGLLTHRVMATYGTGIALLYWIRSGKVSLEDLRVALLVCGWSSLALYMMMFLMMDPVRYGGVRGFVGGGVVEPFHFIFKSPFISFLVIYYVVSAFAKRSIVPLVLTVPLIFYLIFVDGGRSQFLSLMLILGWLLVTRVSIGRLLSLGIPFLVLLVVSIAALHQYRPDVVEHQVEKFYAAIYVVTTGKESSDSSANARLREQQIAMPYIKRNIVFGNGQLSAQWQGGYFGQIGQFAPSDIGVLGLLFVFGIFGLVVFYAQFLFAWRATRKIRQLVSRKRIEDSTFRVAISSFIVFLFVDSLATGRVVFAGSVSFLFISILYGYLLVPAREKRKVRRMRGAYG